MDHEGPVELVEERSLCPSCGESGATAVHRVGITQNRAGWTVSGAGRVHRGTGHCSRCGAVCQVVLTHLPIELAGVPCPTCQRTDAYEYDLDSVDAAPGEFSFTASVRCPGCSTRSFTRRIFGGLRRIKHLKVGPTGVEIGLESPR